MKQMETQQVKFWKGDFGKQYTDRNIIDEGIFDSWHLERFGATRTAINQECIGLLDKNSKILEVGCNVGQQLACIQKMGFKNLHGIEIQEYAVEKAKTTTTGINIIQGSGFDLPYKDGWFDLVCTNGVLIHISPNDYDRFMSEMYRVSSKYIMGFEYYADEVTPINYRGNTGFLWKADFSKEFIKRFSVKEVYRKYYPYQTNNEAGNVDYAYLLEKVKNNL